MSQVAKLESLLSLVQRNRQKPRADGTAPASVAAAPAAPARASRPSPLEVAIGSAADPAPPVKAPPKPKPKAQPVAKISARPTPVAVEVPASLARTPLTAKPVTASAIAAKSAPIAAANESRMVVEAKSFGDLLGRSLALRPR